MKSLNEIVAELRMGDDGGKPAYRIGRTDKVDVSMPSGTPVRSYVIECVTIKELADWIEAAVARERGPGNAAAMRDALVKIRDKCVIYNNDLAQEIDALCGNALSAPARNCDLKECSTDDGLISAHERFCESWHDDGNYCSECPYNPRAQQMITCQARWLLAPAAERKGEGDGR